MKTGIIGAMDVEVASLRKTMKISRTLERAGMLFSEGTVGENEAVIVQSGVGKVNAASCVQILADIFEVTQIINTGVAGSLNNEINIGDIVISTDAVYHDVNATVFGYQKGEVPQMHRLSFPADETLRMKAAAACHKKAPDISVFEGRIASGDQFICEKASKDYIRNTFNAMCTEMEGCAIAHTAFINHLPFVIIRAISDKADESVTMSYDTFEAKAARHCADIVEYMVRSF